MHIFTKFLATLVITGTHTILYLHKSIYKLKRIASPEENFGPQILIKNQVETWKKLKSHNVPEAEI